MKDLLKSLIYSVALLLAAQLGSQAFFTGLTAHARLSGIEAAAAIRLEHKLQLEKFEYLRELALRPAEMRIPPNRDATDDR